MGDPNLKTNTVIEDSKFPFVPKYNVETRAAIDEIENGDLVKVDSIEKLHHWKSNLSN